MFKVVGIKEILGNIICLTKSHLNDIPNKKTLRKSYYDFLRIVQPKVPKPDSINLSYKWKKEEVNLLLEVFQEDSILDDFEDVFDLESTTQSETTLRHVQSALKRMSQIVPSFQI